LYTNWFLTTGRDL